MLHFSAISIYRLSQSMFLEGWKLKEGKRIKESQILWKSRSQVSGSENLEVYGHEIRKKESYIKFKNETNKCLSQELKWMRKTREERKIQKSLLVKEVVGLLLRLYIYIYKGHWSEVEKWNFKWSISTWFLRSYWFLSIF